MKHFQDVVRSDVYPWNLAMPRLSWGRLPVLAACGLAIFFTFEGRAWSLTGTQVYAKVSQSLVVVEVADGEGKVRAQGSGVAVKTGEIVTNCHVLTQGERYSVRRGNAQYKATLRYADPKRDLCQLSSPTLKALAVAVVGVQSVKPGDRVFALGAPQGLELTISEGLVSAVRELDGEQVIQTTAPISPGSSGGGLFDEDGRLVGITTFYLRAGQNLNFAIPAQLIAELASRNSKLTASKPPTKHSTDSVPSEEPSGAKRSQAHSR